MRSKIQKSMELILVITLLASYGVLTAVVYNQTLSILKDEVKQETGYIQTAINMSGASYLDHLEELDSVDEATRLTWIDKDGTVLYDSESDDHSIENHSSRPEFQKAVKGEAGEDVRLSGTVGKQLYYYAVALEDGTVLRASKSMDSMVNTALNMFPILVVSAVIMLLLVWILARWQTSRIISPINDLDIEHPLDNEVYNELHPLLKAIDAQNKEKDAVAQMRKEFSANVSHELKTPLTSISGYAEIMMNGLVRAEDIPNFSERIYKEARRLITLIEDIIKLSKLDEESVELEKEEVNLYALTREICTRLSPQAEKRNVRIEVSGEPVMYRGIRQILDEMVCNICENAIKYNYDGGSVDIWVGKTLSGPKIVVTDTGIGIPTEHQERIIERYYRVDKSHSKEHGGTGLGLSIVKHGALLHGIAVRVESVKPHGTKMTLQF